MKRVPDERPISPSLPRREFLLRAAGLLGFGLLAPGLFAQAADRLYRVKKGDTLSAIARDHGVSVSSIRSANRLSSDRITVGQKLRIPSSAGGSTPPAAAGALSPVLAASRGLRITPGRWTHLVIHHSGIEAGNAKSYDGGQIGRAHV